MLNNNKTQSSNQQMMRENKHFSTLMIRRPQGHMTLAQNSLNKFGIQSKPTSMQPLRSFFLKNNRILKQQNHIVVSIILKTAHITKVAYYKPISYYIVFYKVISKFLAMRLVEIADHLLHLTYTTFVKSRSIIDNIHLAKELMRNYARKRISPRCILKVDLQKTFDSIHQSFLQCLFRVAFP